jgi:hypothetical protein
VPSRRLLVETYLVEVHADGPHEREQQSNHGAEPADLLADIQNLGLQPGVVHVEHVARDHSLRFTAEPASRRGAGYPELRDDVHVTRHADVLPEPVVVRPLSPRFGCGHPRIVPVVPRWRNLLRRRPRRPQQGSEGAVDVENSEGFLQHTRGNISAPGAALRWRVGPRMPADCGEIS